MLTFPNHFHEKKFINPYFMLIKVVPYNPQWPDQFQREASSIQHQLQDGVVHIHHIGSTSVPGLMAKPIIDIILEVRDLASLDRQQAKMEEIGYEVMGEYGISGRRYFRKGGDQRTHHVHAFATGDPHIKRHLAFRDYLIAHKEVAKAYGELKREIASRIQHSMEHYGDAKGPFVQEHEAKALRWYDEQ